VGCFNNEKGQVFFCFELVSGTAHWAPISGNPMGQGVPKARTAVHPKVPHTSTELLPPGIRPNGRGWLVVVLSQPYTSLARKTRHLWRRERLN